MVLRALTHAPYFDETLHVRFVWLLSTGMKPEADFFCEYPVLAYICELPFVKILPQSVYFCLGLRGLSLAICCLTAWLFYRHGKSTVGDGFAGLFAFLLVVAAPDSGAFLAEYSIDHLAALIAVAAMSFFFRPCSPARLSAACGLALFSVAVTPKYAVPLFFGLLGYFAAALIPPDWRRRGRMAAAAAVGGLAALLLIVLLYRLANVSLAANIRYSHLLMSRVTLEVQNRPASMSVGEFAWGFLIAHWPVTIVLVVAIACWVYRVRREEIAVWLPGAGILLGIAVYAIRIWYTLPLEQYMTPILISAAMFGPYGFPRREGGAWRRRLRWLLLAAAAMVVSWQVFRAAHEFRQTPYNVRSTESIGLRTGRLLMQPSFLRTLRFYDACLRLIPPNERVVVVWPYHPLFRKDLTWVTFDVFPSFSHYMSSDDPALPAYAVEAFCAALEKKPPAFIVTSLLETNYPPGWAWACRDFLARHESEYVSFPVDSSGASVALRRDLVPDRDAATKRLRNSLEIWPWEAPTLVAFADALAAHGQADEAIAKYRMALEVDYDNLVAHYKLGMALSSSGRKEEAIPHLQRAIDLCQGSVPVQVHVNLAEVLADRSRRHEALAHFRRALDLASAQNDKATVEKILARMKLLGPDSAAKQTP